VGDRRERARCVPDEAVNRGYWQSLTGTFMYLLTCARARPGMAAHVLLSSRSRVRVAVGALLKSLVRALAESWSGRIVISALCIVPHTCHTVVWRIVLRAQFGLRPARHGIGEVILPGTGRVQVDESGAAGGVAHAFHQFTRVGACLGDELVTGMAEVVKVDAETGCGECAIPDPTAEWTPPPAPWISTRWSAATWAVSTRACHAVRPASGSAAASA